MDVDPLKDSATGIHRATAGAEDDMAPEILEEAAFVERVRGWLRRADSVFDKWATQARECYDFVAGHQWSDEDVKRLEADGRPIITFNRLGTNVDVVVGIEVNNRSRAVFKPRSEDDGLVTEVATRLYEHQRDVADAKSCETEAFRDLLVSGMGWIEQAPSSDIAGTAIGFDHIDPFEMRWPPGARRRNLEDAPWLIRVRKVDRVAAEEMFPETPWSELDASWAAVGGGTDKSPSPPRYTTPLEYDESLAPEEITVVAVQWVAIEPDYVFVARDPETGAMDELTEEEADRLRRRLPDAEIARIERGRIRRVYQAIIGRNRTIRREVVSEGPGASFTWRCATGKWDRKLGIWYGMVRDAIDPQRYANKALQSILEIIAVGPKGGIFFEDDAVDDPQVFVREYANPQAAIRVNPGALQAGKIKDRKPAQYPAGIERFMELSLAGIRDSTGVSKEMLGLREAQQPGILESLRKQSSVTILAVYFESLRRMRKSAAFAGLNLIATWMPPEEMIRIVGRDKAEAVQALLSADVRFYDVVIDEAPDSPNAKDRTWAALSSVMPVMERMGLPQEVWLKVFSMSPVPQSFVDEIAQIMQRQQPDPAEMAAREAQLRNDMAKVEQTKARAEKEAAAAEKYRAEAILAATEAGKTARDAQIEEELGPQIDRGQP